jgi:hypothetical protein
LGHFALKGQWLKRPVLALDRWLRRRQGVFEYAATRDCFFRIERGPADRHLRLRDGTTIAPGDPMLILHLWNENMPEIGEEGPTVAWARRFQRGVDSSLRELAAFLKQRSDLNGISALRIRFALGGAERNRQVTRILTRYGFEEVPGGEDEPARFFRRVGENILILLLILAANPNAARASLFRPERAVAYLSRAAMERRYLTGSTTP